MIYRTFRYLDILKFWMRHPTHYFPYILRPKWVLGTIISSWSSSFTSANTGEAKTCPPSIGTPIRFRVSSKLPIFRYIETFDTIPNILNCEHSSVENVGNRYDHLLLSVTVQVREHRRGQNMPHGRSELLQISQNFIEKNPIRCPKHVIVAHILRSKK